MVTKKYLFSNSKDSLEDILEINKRCDTSHVIEKFRNVVSEDCLDFTLKLLNADPDLRLTC